MAMRVLYPDIHAIWPGLANPHESSYALAALTLLPNGLVGIMLAAMFSSTMANVSGLLNLHASIISKDIFPTLVPRKAGEAEKLTVGWISTFGVGTTIITIAMIMALSGQSVFRVMVIFNTIMSLAYGPPALLGLVVRRTPSWSGLASFLVGLVLGMTVTFGLGWGLVGNVLTVVPASVAVFFLCRLFPETDPGHAARQERLSRRLDTPVDVAAEVDLSHDPTAQVFRFLSRCTGAVGLLCLPLVFTAAPSERGTVWGYVGITLVLAVLLSRVRGKSPVAAGTGA
jgi:Na+/proline symporter